jgi:hypothetical protein
LTSFVAAFVPLMLLLAGCAARHETDGVSPSSSNLPSQTGSNPNSRPSVSGAFFGVNLTNCKGQLLFLFPPVSMVQDDLPPGYSARAVAPGVTQIIFEVNACYGAAANGKDVRAASIAMVFAPVSTTGGSTSTVPRGEEFLFEMRTNNSALQEWFAGPGKQSEAGDVQSEVFTSAAFSDVLAGRIKSGSQVLYDWKGPAITSLLTSTENTRLYWGPNPKTDFWDVDSKYGRSSSDGPADLSLSSDSRVSRVLGGITHSGATLSIRNLASGIFRGPVP